jgi:hypothetical protein
LILSVVISDHIPGSAALNFLANDLLFILLLKHKVVLNFGILLHNGG